MREPIESSMEKRVDYQVMIPVGAVTLDPKFYKTTGNRWKKFGARAPRPLVNYFRAAKSDPRINNLRRCSGEIGDQYFCGTVTVISPMSRMGAYLRRKREGIEKVPNNQLWG